MERKKYYVSIASTEISQIPYHNNDDFIIYATDHEVRMLREKMNNMYDANLGAFWRAHVPIVPYHNDQPNDDYDKGITEAFQMIYDLGDEKTKAHIETMGVLDERHM